MNRSRRPIAGQRLLSLGMVAITICLMLVPTLPIPGTSAQEDVDPISGDVIVVLKDNVPAGTFAESSDLDGIEPTHVYTEVFDGFAAEITPEQAEELAADPNVVAIYENTLFRQADQTLPTGVNRIDADVNPSSDIDGMDDIRVNADVAVLDTGISSTTGDLNLVGGTDCVGGAGFDQDGTGHGTHVSGTIGALDNAIDVVGVAPGVRLWSVRVLNSFGNGSAASIVCGLDWVARRASTIEAVNMSLEGGGSDGDCDSDAVHLAVCAVVNDAHVPVVVAAGNGSRDAEDVIPAAYDQVISVSSFADFDGLPGGISAANGCSPTNSDDNFASTSNFGADIDIAAPGVCILSTAPGGGAVLKSGTSMATPHVTGAIALYKAINPYAPPNDVKAWLMANAQAQGGPNGFTGDDDGIAEPVVWLGGGDPVPTATATQVPTSFYPLVRSGASAKTAASTYVRDNKLDKIWKTKSYWTGGNPWVWVDLGSRKQVGTIRWVFGQTGIADDFVIEGSNNLLTWEIVASRSNAPVGAWQEININKNYRYVRWRFFNVNAQPEVGGLWEVQVWAPGIAPPLGSTPTPTPTATAPPNAGYPFYGSQRTSNSTDPKAIWDGDLETTWQSDGLSTPTSAWVLVTLGSVKPIGAIRWQYGTADIGDDLIIEVSDDKVTWSTVHTEQNNSPADVWLDVQDLVGVSGKYVRWRFANPNSDPVIGGLAEVEVWAPGEFGGGSERSPSATATSTPVPVTSTNTPEPTSTTEPATPEPTVTETAVEVPTETATVVEEASPVAEEPTEVATDIPTEVATAESSDPTPYAIVQTSRSASTEPGTLAIDGDPETVWGLAPDADPGRVVVLTLDLGEVVEIDEVRMLFGPDGLLGNATIETSSDDVAWTMFGVPDLAETGDDGWLAIGPDASIELAVEARYVRVVIVAGTEGEPLGGIAEIEVYPPLP